MPRFPRADAPPVEICYLRARIGNYLHLIFTAVKCACVRACVRACGGLSQRARTQHETYIPGSVVRPALLFTRRGTKLATGRTAHKRRRAMNPWNKMHASAPVKERGRVCGPEEDTLWRRGTRLATGRTAHKRRRAMNPGNKMHASAPVKERGRVCGPEEDTLWRFAGVAVAERLACSPSTKAIRVQSPAGSPRIFACGNRAGRCCWRADFSRDLPFPPAFSFRRCSIVHAMLWHEPHVRLATAVPWKLPYWPGCQLASFLTWCVIGKRSSDMSPDSNVTLPAMAPQLSRLSGRVGRQTRVYGEVARLPLIKPQTAGVRHCCPLFVRDVSPSDLRSSRRLHDNLLAVVRRRRRAHLQLIYRSLGSILIEAHNTDAHEKKDNKVKYYAFVGRWRSASFLLTISLSLSACGPGYWNLRRREFAIPRGAIAVCQSKQHPAGSRAERLSSLHWSPLYTTFKFLISTLKGATVDERLDCSPPTKANRVQFQAGSLRWESCRTMPLVGGFSRRSPVSSAPFIPALLHT
ncbi:hypothetical protein PR048_004324 [Dryococelus australis]|uniref:Uncharacterized protein n=1 Tax=Dryococelus australis TaxID=614101 RepID=A0ABQ9I5Y5_9NEOP|nr:hypothetical protein PR048_004324 [Dryococelus australis]